MALKIRTLITAGNANGIFNPRLRTNSSALRLIDTALLDFLGDANVELSLKGLVWGQVCFTFTRLRQARDTNIYQI